MSCREAAVRRWPSSDVSVLLLGASEGLEKASGSHVLDWVQYIRPARGAGLPDTGEKATVITTGTVRKRAS